jgi:acetyl esterase/lipase
VLSRPALLLPILAVCLAGVLALYLNRKPVLIWASGHRYRPRIPPEVQVLRDIPYTVFRGRSMKLDIYLPPSDGPHPLIVWLHSGAWKTLDRSCIEQGAMDQVLRGYALASVDYSLSSEEKWPAQLEEVRAAIHWLAANATKYRFDRTGVVLWGMSAGGHIASVVGASADLDTEEHSFRVLGVVAWCAPTDLSALSGSGYAAARQLLGDDPGEDSGKENPANPTRYIGPGDPPFFILHGSHDRVVPVAHAIRFTGELERAGIAVTFVERDNYSHEDVRFNSRECMVGLERFLDRLYSGKAGP